VDDRVERLRRTGARTTAISTEDDAFARLMDHFHRVERRR
jgi:hypothetical protein